MKVDVEIREVTQAFRKLRGDLSGPKFNRAVYRSLNHTLSKSKTRASRAIRKDYKFKARDVKKTLLLRKAGPGRLHADLRSKSGPQSVRLFTPRQTRRGVKVTITKGRRKLINRAFVATMKSGHKSVFARGVYKRGQGFQFRKGRTTGSRTRGSDLPITALKTTSTPQLLGKPQVLSSLERQITADYPKRLSHLLSRES